MRQQSIIQHRDHDVGRVCSGGQQTMLLHVVSFLRVDSKRATGADQHADSATLTQAKTLCGALSGERSSSQPHVMSPCGGPVVRQARKIRLPLRALPTLLRFGQCQATRHSTPALSPLPVGVQPCGAKSSSFRWRPRYAKQAIPAVLTRSSCAHDPHHTASTQRAAPYLGRPFISATRETRAASHN